MARPRELSTPVARVLVLLGAVGAVGSAACTGASASAIGPTGVIPTDSGSGDALATGDTGTTTDAPESVDGNRPFDAGGGTKPDAGPDGASAIDAGGSTKDASADAHGRADGGPLDAGANGDGGGLGGSCMKALYGTYVQRVDGPLLWEGASQAVLDTNTGVALAGVTSVHQGMNHACAAIADGSAQCWLQASGGNTFGELGNGTTSVVNTTLRATPVLSVGTTALAGIVSVPDGRSNYSCAITTGGGLSCWGDLTNVANNSVQLWSGYAQPITLDGTHPFTGVTEAALGPGGMCAIIGGTPNQVWCWGYNSMGELAQGDTTFRQYPTQVHGLTNPTKLVAAEVNGAALDATFCALDGWNVLCWGSNSSGAAGVNNVTATIQAPTIVVPPSGAPALPSFVDVHAGSTGFSTLGSDGTLWSWGAGVTYAASIGVSNALALGWGNNWALTGPRYVASDGTYYAGSTSMTVNCGAL